LWILTVCRDAGHPGGTQCTTVIYTVNARPIVCENPFRKVFARRQQFYKARERRTASPDPSSKRLLWRPCDHACRRNSLCPDRQPPPVADDERAATLPSPSPRFFTLNAHIQPFAAFSIRHDLSSGSDQEMSSSSCSAVNLTLCSDKSQPVEVLPDGQVNTKRTQSSFGQEPFHDGAARRAGMELQKHILLTQQRALVDTFPNGR
jgi:hypothetical protein